MRLRQLRFSNLNLKIYLNLLNHGRQSLNQPRSQFLGYDIKIQVMKYTQIN